MLTPEQLKKISESMNGLLQELEEFVIKDIARRIGGKGGLTETAKDQIKKSLGIGVSLDRIEEEIQRATGSMLKGIDREIRSEIDEAARRDSLRYAAVGKAINPESPGLKHLMMAGIAQTKSELSNFTRSLGFAVKENGEIAFKPLAKFYQNTLDLAHWQVSTGITDYRTATRNAVKTMANSGLRTVNYASGHTNLIDVAARRAVLTGVNQMNLRMTDQIMQDLGAEFVEVSAHVGARPDHQVWQGRVYHVCGAKEGYPDFVSSTGYGTGPGLGGWNCRHTYFPFFPGVSTRTYTDDQLRYIDPPPRDYNGKTYTYYDATQKQRRMETAIRKTKNEAAGYKAAGLNGDFKTASIKLGRQKQAYREFSKAMNIRPKMERTQVYGFGRSVAQKARWAGYAGDKVIRDYISSASYKINEKLRQSLSLTEADKRYIKELDRALEAMPDYQGKLSRSLFFLNDAARADFIKKHSKGNVIGYAQYLSATKGTIYNPKGHVQIRIISKNGKDISRYNRAEQEVLFRRNSRFRVEGVRAVKGITYIIMREV